MTASGEAAGLLDRYEERSAAVAEHKRAIRHHRQRLRAAATDRDRLIAQLEALGIVVELQGAEEKPHGRD